MDIGMIIVLILAVLSFITSAIGSATAFVTYARRDDASLIGFGFANFFHGPTRTSHPHVFFASIGGAALGILLVLSGALFR